MSKDFHKYIKAVGTGIKHNYDLDNEQMQDCMDMILRSEASSEQISAFLIAWRLKPETIDEFKSTIDLFEKYTKKITIKNSIELGYPYDGKKNNPFLFTLIAKELERFDLNIIVTGDKLQPSKHGVTLKDIATNIQKSKNLYYFDRETIFKELSNLTDIRNALGIRTALNTVERLINPANSDIAFLGVFHKPFMEKYAKMFASKYKKLVIVKGNEGTSEIYSKCQYWIVQDGEIEEFKIDPKDFNINYTKSWDKITLEESLNMINNPDEELMKIVKLNAALILYVSDKASSIEEAYSLLN